MQRRRFITLLGGAAAFPLARAQGAEKLPVVGLVFGGVPEALMAGPDPVAPAPRAFVHGMRDLGWIEGKTVVILRRSAEGKAERAPAIFADLVAQGVDVIAFSGVTSNLEAARQATRTIPLVAAFNVDAVADGRVASLARPGGNLTGLTNGIGNTELLELQLLKELAPGIARVAYVGTREDWESPSTGVVTSGLFPVFALVERAEDYETAFATILRERADALLVAGNAIAYGNRERLIAFAAEHKLPAAFSTRDYVAEGGLMSYGIDFPGNVGQLARIVDKILKGAKPADIPIAQPTKFDLVINLKTANALGLTIPPLLLARADEVIE